MGEDFHSKTHTTYYGKAQAIIRAGTEAGEIYVKVTADKMRTKEVGIEVK